MDNVYIYMNTMLGKINIFVAGSYSRLQKKEPSI